MIRKAKRSSAANLDGSGLPGSVFGRHALATRVASRAAGGSGASAGRIRLTLLASMAVALLALTAAPSATATTTYSYAGSFGGLGEALGQFKAAGNMAVDPTTGLLFLADTGNNRVQAFEPGDCEPTCATPLLEFPVTAPLGIAVDSSNGNVYTTRAGVNEVQKYSNPPSDYTLTFEGETTATLAFNATGAQVAAALTLLPAIGAGNVIGAGAATAQKQVIFNRALASTDVPLLSGPGVTIQPPPTSTAGVPGTVAKFTPDDHLNPSTYTPDGSFTSPQLTGIVSGTQNTTVPNILIVPAFGGIAVDDGSLFLTLGKSVRRFDTSGAPQAPAFDGSDSGTAINAAADLKVDHEGNPIVADIATAAATRVLRFAPDGEFQGSLTPPPPNPNAVVRRILVGADLASGEVFATSSPATAGAPVSICQYEADVQVGCFGTPTASALSYLGGITASGTVPGRVYVIGAVDSFGFPSNPKVHVFEGATPPEVTIDPVDAEDVTATEAEFSGTVNPTGGELTACRFEVAKESEGFAGPNTMQFPCSPDAEGVGTGTLPVPVSATAPDLVPITDYLVRLFAAKEDLSAVTDPESFSTPASPAGVATGGAFSVSDTSATLAGTVDPNNAALADCRFEYGTDEGYGQEVPCSPGLAAIESADEVQQVTVKAKKGTFRLSFGGQTTADIPFDAPAATVQAVLRALSSIGSPNVSVSGGPGDEDGSHPYLVTFEAALGGRDVEPLAATEQFGSLLGSLQGIAIGTIAPGGFPVEVSAEVPGLSPNTTYHFRLVAANECAEGCGAAKGEDAAFATRPPVAFPQRGYEMVSALDTNGIALAPDLAAAGGDRYAYTSVQLPLPGGENGGASFFRASRNPDGSWSQRFVGAPAPRPGESGAGSNSGPLYSAGDLSRVAWGSNTGIDPEDENGAQDSYLRDAGDGSITWLSCTPVPPARECPPTGEEGAGDAAGGAHGPQYVSPDGSRVLFASGRRLLPEDVATGSNPSLYEWDEGRLDLVGVAPGGTAGLPGGSTLGSTNNRRGSGGENAYGNDSTRNAVSRDGSRIAFQSGADATAQRLYVRIGDGATVEASASEGVAPPVGEPRNVNFWGADADLQSVFFTSGSALTADSSAPGTAINVVTGAGGSADLYRYLVPADGNPANGRLLDLTPHPGGAGVLQVFAVSDDGRRLYFLANGALAPGAQPGDCRGSNNIVSGTCNLYLAELGGPADPADPAALTLISRGNFPLGRVVTAGEGTIKASEKLRQAVADPAGSLLAFLSPDALVPGRQTGGHSQVYLYDAVRDELSCASCPADGSIPPAPASLTTRRYAVDYVVGLNNEIHNGVPHMRNVGADGATVFFQTASPLLAADANGKRDVYEYRGGKLALISTAGPAEAIFGDAAADGSTVFFVTTSQVLPGIEGGINRVYAARAGVSDWQPPLPHPPCTGEDCKPVATGQPNYAAPSTATVLGRGNLVEKPARRRCPKGKRKVLRKGGVRCVKKRPKRSHRRAGADRRPAR